MQLKIAFRVFFCNFLLTGQLKWKVELITMIEIPNLFAENNVKEEMYIFVIGFGNAPETESRCRSALNEYLCFRLM